MGKYIAYYRVSTDRQGRSGLGLDAQRARVASYIEQVDGQLVTEYTEVESGKRNSRPELSAALRQCRREGATLVLATLDRLARKVAFIAALMESKTPFVLADMPQAGPFEIHIRAAMAEEEGRKISERTRVALAAAKQRGVTLGNPRLSQLNARRVTDRHSYAATLRDTIEHLQTDGITSITGLARELNRLGIPTITGKGSWYRSTVRALLARLEEQAA